MGPKPSVGSGQPAKTSESKTGTTAKAGKPPQPKGVGKSGGVGRRESLVLFKLSQSQKLKKMAGRKARRRRRRKKRKKPLAQLPMNNLVEVAEFTENSSLEGALRGAYL